MPVSSQFRYLALSLILSGCATALNNKDLQHRYSIESGNQTPFPDRPISMSVTYRQLGTSSSVNPIVSSVEDFSNIQSIKKTSDSRLEIRWKVEHFKREVNKEGKHSVFMDSKILPAAKLSLKIDCSTKKVVEKSGFQETLNRIEKAKPPGEERDILIAGLTGFVERAPDLCQSSEGPFDISKVKGQEPGYRWLENVSVPGLQGSKMNAEFLGWHKRGNESYAVLGGHLDADGLINENGETIKVHATIESYLLVSADWKKIIKDVTSAQSVSASGKTPFSGTLKMNLLSQQLPEGSL